MGSWLNGSADYQRERGEKGFAEIDWWNGNVYLPGVIGSLALHLRDNGHGNPSEVSWDEWQEILKKIGDPLVAYAKAVDGGNESQEQTAAARDALRMFAEWFDRFWD